MSTTSSLKHDLQQFFDKRILTIFAFGMLSGLPWVMIGSALTLWMKEAGVSRTEIGYAGLIFTAFAVNFLWSPLIDQMRIPLFKKLGTRRNWILLCQLILVSACVFMSTLDASSMKLVVATALIIAIAAATQDIAIDAYRVDLFSTQEAGLISAGAAAATSGWWTAYAGLGMIPLMLSDLGWSWPSLYSLMGILSLLIATSVLFSPSPSASSREQNLNELHSRNVQLMTHTSSTQRVGLLVLLILPIALGIFAFNNNLGLPDSWTSHAAYVPSLVLVELLLLLGLLWYLHVLRSTALHHPSAGNPGALAAVYARLLTTIVAPFDDFFSRNGLRLAISLLLFIVLFKFGEAVLGRMSIVFYKEIGFSNTEIAAYSKLLTWLITLVCAIPCALLNARFGLVQGLLISGLFMGASNLMFAGLAYIGPSTPFFIATIVVDGITTAWASIAFVGFISMLCNQTFSASQYALMSSLATLGRTTLAAFSGQIVDSLDGNWTAFFVLTALMVIPSLCILLTLRPDLNKIYAGQRVVRKAAEQ